MLTLDQIAKMMSIGGLNLHLKDIEHLFPEVYETEEQLLKHCRFYKRKFDKDYLRDYAKAHDWNPIDLFHAITALKDWEKAWTNRILSLYSEDEVEDEEWGEITIEDEIEHYLNCCLVLYLAPRIPDLSFSPRFPELDTDNDVPLSLRSRISFSFHRVIRYTQPLFPFTDFKVFYTDIYKAINHLDV